MSRRLLAVNLLASAVLAVGALAPLAPPDTGGLTSTGGVTQDGPTLEGAKTKSGSLAQSDPSILARTDASVIPVMVKVDVDPVASYTGDVDGFAATSPEVTGLKLAQGGDAVTSYTAYVTQVLKDAAAQITADVPSARVLSSLPVAYGGLVITVPAASAKAVLAVPGVAAVQDNSLRQLPASEVETGAAAASVASSTIVKSASTAASGAIDNDASTFIGADAVWPSLGGRDLAGQGVIVGVIDTGIWPEHPMLADNGIAKPAGGPWKCDFGTGGDAAFTCNDKLIGAYAFLDLYREVNDIGAEDFCTADACSARDSDGHGTHTATTAAGSYVTNAPIFGVDRGPVSGIAPGASVIAYRALGPQGGYTSDLLAAVQQSILDGVDVINYSVSGSASVYTDPVELAFLDAYAAGISVNASAGNSGPGASTADHAGPWVTTVGASTFDRAFSSTLTLTSTDGATFSKSGATLTAGVTSAPVVSASAVPGYAAGATCGEPFAAGSLTGKVVVCERGGTNSAGAIGRVQKGYNASLGGAAGMILYNPTASDVETDNHFLPVVHLEGPNPELLAFLAAHTGVTATWAAGQATVAQGDVMAGFSSRGPIGEFLKPDITAPGVQILAGLTPESTDVATGPQGELYQAIAGTSMSSPHAAGVSALVIAAHPTWTPGQVKSALMTSSLQSVVNADGTTAGVFDRGAGSIRANRALSPTLTISESASDFTASAADPLSRLDLNIPSLNIDPLPGAAKTSRTVTNVTSKSQSFRVSATGADGLRITVFPSNFTLAAGASRDLTVIVDGLKAADGWHEGQITLTPTRSGATAVVIPVAGNVGEAAISLTQSCEPAQISRGATTTCTVSASNSLPVAADASIKVLANPLLQVRSVTSPATKTFLGAKWSGTLDPALPPTIDSIAVDPTGGPGGEYLPLSLFGIAPIAGVGDDTLTNFTVPAFLYGGESYTSVGISSNGYLVVGGGTTADSSSTPQVFPDTTAPNNVLAPFWSDLDPSSTGSVSIGTLSDGVTSWLVVDWNGVQTYSQDGASSFQTWIQLGGTEGAWYAYDASPVPDTAAGSSIGAENRDGTSGVNAPQPAAGEVYAVTTTSPKAGGTVSFSYTLRGLIRGSWSTYATLTSPLLGTVPVEQTVIKVK